MRKHLAYIQLNFKEERPFQTLGIMANLNAALKACQASDKDWDKTVLVLGSDYMELVIKNWPGDGSGEALATKLSATMDDVGTCLRNSTEMGGSLPYFKAVKDACDPTQCTLEELQRSMAWLSSKSNKDSYRGVLALMTWPAGEKVIKLALEAIDRSSENNAVESLVAGTVKGIGDILAAMTEAVGKTPDATRMPRLGEHCKALGDKIIGCNSSWTQASKGLRTVMTPSLKELWDLVERAFDALAEPCQASLVSFHNETLKNQLEELAVSEEDKFTEDQVHKHLNSLDVIESSFSWVQHLIHALGPYAKMSVDNLMSKVPPKLASLFVAAQFVCDSGTGQVAAWKGDLYKATSKDTLECARVFMKASKHCGSAISLVTEVSKDTDIKHMAEALESAKSQCEETTDHVKSQLEGYATECKTKFEKELVRSLFSADDSDRDLVWPPALSAADIQQKVLELPPAATEELTLSIVEKVCGPDEVLKVQMWSKVDNFQRAVIAFYDVLGRLTPVSEMTAKDYVFEEKLVKGITSMADALRSLKAVIAPVGLGATGKAARESADKEFDKASVSLNRSSLL